jgi:hypothetical protein
MTPAGGIEVPLLALQLSASIIATWAGIRIVDDVRLWLARRAEVRAEDQA